MIIPRETLYEIAYFQSFGNYVKAYNVNGHCRVVRATLKSILSSLPANYFCRVHNQSIVQLSQIKSLKGNTQRLVLTFKTIEDQVNVSRKYIKEFKKDFAAFQEAAIVFTKNDPGYFF